MTLTLWKNIEFAKVFFVTVATKGKPAPVLKEPPLTNITKTVKSFQCNFEGGLCSMMQDKVDQRDFVLHQGRTYLQNTGPLRDHTTGTGNEYYK